MLTEQRGPESPKSEQVCNGHLLHENRQPHLKTQGTSFGICSLPALTFLKFSGLTQLMLEMKILAFPSSLALGKDLKS